MAISVLVAFSLMLSGCAFLLVGAAGGAGGYAWSQGKLSFTTAHSVTECHDATIAALKSLGIMIVSDKTDKLAGKITGKTSTGTPIVIDLEPEEGNLTKLDIRVGYWGNKVMSERIADEIKQRL
jgi:hypothetical protein